jgi:hypothetical protein
LKILQIEIKKTTALEIIKAFPDGLDYMITGELEVILRVVLQF